MGRALRPRSDICDTGQRFAVRPPMKTRRVLTFLVALVLVPFVLSWGTLLLIPAMLLLVPCVLLAAIVALPVMLVAVTSARHDAHHPQAPVSTTPIFMT